MKQNADRLQKEKETDGETDDLKTENNENGKTKKKMKIQVRIL